MKLAVAFVALVPLAFGGMHPVWEVRLDKNLVEPPGWPADPDQEVQALAFSPNGSRLAVLIVHSLPPSRSARVPTHTHVFVADTSSPKAAPLRFDLKSCIGPMRWSPTGEALKLCRSILRLSDGAVCQTDEAYDLAGFIDGQRYLRVSQFVKTPPGSSPTHTTFFIDDLDCVNHNSWDVAGAWRIMQIQSSRNVVLLLRLAWTILPANDAAWLPTRPSYRILLNLASHRPLDAWDNQAISESPFFMDNGSKLCSWSSSGPKNRDHNLQCWDLDSAASLGTVLRVTKERPWDFLPSDPVTGGTRVLTRVVRYIPIPAIFEDLMDSELPGKRKVWDIRSGREVVSWNPRQQEVNYVRGRHSVDDPVAISPDGHFIAEGGNGVVRLYRID